MQNNNNTQNVSLLYGNYVERNQEFVAVADRIMEAKKMIAYYENIVENQMERMKEIAQGVNSRGGGFIFYSIKRKGAIEYSRIPGIETFDLEKYRKPEVTYWKIDKE